MPTAPDWRTSTRDRLREIILSADPSITEERKWKKPTNPAGVPVFSHHGILCTLETYKNSVKLTFAKGASLPDPHRLFNASLDGNARRAIDFHEGDPIPAPALRELIRAAIHHNLSS